ncbi:MAG: polysaccharide deacetylase family protein [Pyrinomonadaceae bacterium]
MEFLSVSGYQTVTLNDLIGAFLEKRPLSHRTVVITFDDGFQNFYTTAYPTLEEYGFSATVFLVTDHCGKFNDWSGNPTKLPRSEMLSWAQVKELSRFGIEFGGHTRAHRDLTKLSERDIRAEMVGSKVALEDIIGKNATTFAYPYGKLNDRVRQIARDIFAAACSTNLGKVTSSSDPYSLSRVDTYYLSNPIVFESLSQRSFDRYLQVRQAMRRLRLLIDRN